MHNVEVRLGARSYHVRVRAGLLSTLGRQVREILSARRCAIITDSNVGPLYAAAAEQSLAAEGFEPVVITVPAGERSKALDQAGAACERMIDHGIDRSGCIVALGGGVVGDLAGFVAAIYYRGIPYVQAPTTILAQVDSSVGGKTGVNAAGGKNLIGAFHQPRLVMADTETLKTLPQREFNEGFAEIIKHAVIRDRAMLDDLDTPDLAPLIARNVAIKAEIVAADEHETTGERALLNFGHTIGHGIENAAGYGRFLHGEAISLGIVAALNISTRKAGLSMDERALVASKLRHFNLPTQLSADVATDAVMDALSRDKKFAAGKIRFVLCARLGEARLSSDVTTDEIRDAVEELR